MTPKIGFLKLPYRILPRVRFLSLSVAFLILGCEEKPLGSPLSSVSSTHSWLTENHDVDSDGDGLSDFQELHKYFTDSNDKDSDHDGIPDGDWHERQEFTYVIQSTVEVVRPVSLDAANSDYQDARIIAENSKSVSLEVLSFPLNSNKLAVSENRNWKTDYASMSKYLVSTRTSNYDAGTASDIIIGIKSKFGLDLFTLTDKQAVEWVTAFISSEHKNTTPFMTYFVDFPTSGQVSFPHRQICIYWLLFRSGLRIVPRRY